MGRARGRSGLSADLERSLATNIEESVPVQRICQKDTELGSQHLNPVWPQQHPCAGAQLRCLLCIRVPPRLEPQLKGLAGRTNLLLTEFSRLLGLKISEGGNLRT